VAASLGQAPVVLERGVVGPSNLARNPGTPIKHDVRTCQPAGRRSARSTAAGSGRASTRLQALLPLFGGSCLVSSCLVLRHRPAPAGRGSGSNPLKRVNRYGAMMASGPCQPGGWLETAGNRLKARAAAQVFRRPKTVTNCSSRQAPFTPRARFSGPSGVGADRRPRQTLQQGQLPRH